MKIDTRALPAAGRFDVAKPWLRVTATFAVLAILVGACGGGGDDDSPSPTPTTPAAATGSNPSTGSAGSPTGTTGNAQPTGSTGDASTGAGPTGSASPTGSAPPAMSDLADLTGLDSFRWDITMSGAGSFLGATGLPAVPGADDSEFVARGAYIAPDQAQVTLSVAGFEYKQTVKEGQQWTTIAGQTTGPVPATTTAEDLIYVSTFVDPQNVIEGGSMDCNGTEDVNGLSATRCETTEEVNQQIVESLAGDGATATDASFVVWVAEEGDFIVRWEFNASGTANNEPFEWSFLANITDVNSVDSIEP